MAFLNQMTNSRHFFVFALAFFLPGAALYAADFPAHRGKAAPDEKIPFSAPHGSTDDAPPSTGQQIFQLLLGEIALQRNQHALAVNAYADLATRTQDPAVMARAVALAAAFQQYDLALNLARQWRQLDEDSQEALQAEVNLLALTSRMEEIRAPLEKFFAIDSKTNLPANFVNLGRLLVRQPDKKTALDLMGHMALLYPDQPEAHYALALVALSAEQPQKARLEAQKAQALKPGWFDPVSLETQIILRENTDKGAFEAIQILEGYLQRNPDAENADEARMAVARMLLGQKRYKEAREIFDQLLKKSPDSPEVIYPLAMLALQNKDTETARGLLMRLAELPFADQNSVRYFLGLLEEEAGNFDLAAAHYQQVSGGAQYIPAQFRIAKRLSAQGQIDKAIEMVRKIKTQTPQEKITLVLFESDLLREAGQYQPAYETLAAELKRQPEQPTLLYSAALSAEKIGRYDVMETLFKKLIAVQPDNAHAYNAFGYSLAERNTRIPEAYGLIEKALSLEPENPLIMDSMGWVLYRQGKLEEARLLLERAYYIESDPEIAAHLSEILWMQGQKDKAREIWEKANRQSPGNETLRAVLRKFQP